jgi:hypothetical protein
MIEQIPRPDRNIYTSVGQRNQHRSTLTATETESLKNVSNVQFYTSPMSAKSKVASIRQLYHNKI